MKIGAIVAVNCGSDSIEFALKGIYDFCNKIVIVYSDVTWLNEKKEDGTLDIIESFPYQEKLEVIKGSFPSQVQQRNEALEKLKEDNYDYIFVVDSDEIYNPEALKGVRLFIGDNKDEPSFQVTFRPLWKTCGYELIPHQTFVVVYKITPNLRFTGPGRQTMRGTKKVASAKHLGVDCFHLTCVCTDEFMAEKLRSRSYKKKVRPHWFENVWKKWKPEMENLHPTKPWVYEKAVPIEQKLLPDFLKTHRFYK